jgi:hypothetical protein
MDTTSSSTLRAAAALLVAGGTSSLLLLALHPHEAGTTLDAVIGGIAAHAVADAWVHGGMMLVLALLLAAMVLLTRDALAPAPVAVVAAVLFGAGCMLMTSSLVLDGFVVPQIAQRYAGDTVAPVREGLLTMIKLCGTTIHNLMPLGLTGQVLAVLLWSVALVRESGARRAVGAAGACLAIAVAAAVRLGLDEQHLLLGALAALALWYVGFGVALWRHHPAPARALAAARV